MPYIENRASDRIYRRWGRVFRWWRSCTWYGLHCYTAVHVRTLHRWESATHRWSRELVSTDAILHTPHHTYTANTMCVDMISPRQPPGLGVLKDRPRPGRHHKDKNRGLGLNSPLSLSSTPVAISDLWLQLKSGELIQVLQPLLESHCQFQQHWHWWSQGGSIILFWLTGEPSNTFWTWSSIARSRSLSASVSEWVWVSE